MKLKFNILSNNSVLLKSYCQIFGKYLEIFTLWIHTEPHLKGYSYNNLICFKYLMFNLTVCKRKYTVIRSIHIYNKSREQFKKLEYKLLFHIFLKEFLAAEAFYTISLRVILKKMLKWLPSGLSLRFDEEFVRLIKYK